MWPFKRRRERRALFQLGGAFPTNRSLAGVTVDADQAQRLTAVWACVKLLSESVSTLPLDTYRLGEAGERVPLPTPPVLVTPAAGWTLQEWLEAQMRSALLRGNAYALVVARGPSLRPTQLEPLDPGSVTLRRDRDGALVVRVGGTEVDPADLWHLRAYCQPGSPVGLSPIEYARDSLGLGLAADEYGARFFGAGSTPSGILQTDADLEEGDATALKDRWEALHAGPVNAYKVAVLDNGAKWQPVGLPNDQAQFLETRRFQVAEVCRLFGVDPALVASGTEDSQTYANVEGRSLHFATYGLRPWLVRLEAALGSLLPRGQYVRFNSGALLKATLLQRYQAHEVALRAGFLTVNEVRALEDLPPLPEPQRAAA